MFQYVSADEQNREDLIVDYDDKEGNDCAQSDLVRIVMNLAFIKEDIIRNMPLDADQLTQMKLQNRERDIDVI